jgi:hypothetical protein
MTARTAQDHFKAMVGDLAAALKREGFRKSGQTFGLRGDRVWGVISIQKSQWSSHDSISFTLNVGVFCERIGALRLFDHERGRIKKGALPSGSRCQWRERIGMLLPDPGDRWWETDDRGLGPRNAPDVTESVVKHAVPLLRRLNSEGALLKHVRRGPEVGMFTLHRVALINLCGTEAELNRFARARLKCVTDADDRAEFLAGLRKAGYRGPAGP